MSLRDIFSYVAKQIFFDNSGSSLVSEDVEAAIKEVNNEINTSASPGFTWGNSGNTTSGTWLLNDSVPSNKAGRAIFIDSPTLESVFIRCELISTFDIEVYEHDGTTYTLITTINVVASRGGDFTVASIPLTKGKELALKLVNGTAKNPVAGCVLKGTF